MLEQEGIQVDGSKKWHTKGYAEELEDESGVDVRFHFADANNPRKLMEDLREYVSKNNDYVDLGMGRGFAKGGTTSDAKFEVITTDNNDVEAQPIYFDTLEEVKDFILKNENFKKLSVRDTNQKDVGAFFTQQVRINPQLTYMLDYQIQKMKNNRIFNDAIRKAYPNQSEIPMSGGFAERDEEEVDYPQFDDEIVLPRHNHASRGGEPDTEMLDYYNANGGKTSREFLVKVEGFWTEDGNKKGFGSAKYLTEYVQAKSKAEATRMGVDMFLAKYPNEAISKVSAKESNRENLLSPYDKLKFPDLVPDAGFEYAKGGEISNMYVVVGDKDNYWTILSKPSSKENSQKLLGFTTLPRGYAGKVVSVEDAKKHKLVIGREYLGYNTMTLDEDDTYIIDYSKTKQGKFFMEFLVEMNKKGYSFNLSKALFSLKGAKFSKPKEDLNKSDYNEIENWMAKWGGFERKDSTKHTYSVVGYQDNEKGKKKGYIYKSGVTDLDEAISEAKYLHFNMNYRFAEVQDERGKVIEGFPIEKYAKGGKFNEDLYFDQLASMSGTRAVAIKEWASANNLSQNDILSIIQGLGRKQITSTDFVTALLGNESAKSMIIAYAKSGKAFQMAKGGEAEKAEIGKRLDYMFEDKEYQKPRGKTIYRVVDVELEDDENWYDADDDKYTTEEFENYEEALSAHADSEVGDVYPITWTTYLDTKKPPFVYESGVVLSDGRLYVQFRKGVTIGHDWDGNENGYENKKNKKLSKGGEIEEGNYEMMLSQTKEVQHHAKELQDILKKEKEIEAWVVAKMENVSSTLSDITHYLDGKTQYADGGRVKGRNPKTGEDYGVVIGSVTESEEKGEGYTQMNVRKAYGSRISEMGLIFNPQGNLYMTKDYGYSLDGYPNLSHNSGHTYNADKKETLQILSRIYNPSFAKKLIELATTKMAKGGTTPSLSSVNRKYLKNEDENRHSENVVLLATNFGDADDLKLAKEILRKHNAEGSLSSENGKKRQELHLKLIAIARKEFAKEGIQFAKGGTMKQIKRSSC
jgi:hypothetical protein